MKRFLNTLTKDELKLVFNANSKIRQDLYESIKEQDGEFAQEQYNMFLKDARSYYTYHDNYNSYFLRLRDLDGYYFLSNMNFADIHDYSIVSDAKIEEIKKTMEQYEKIDYSIATDEEIDELQDKLDELAKEVLSGIEKYLHEIEDADYTEEDLFEEFWERTEDWYDGYYINVSGDGTIKCWDAYCDFTKCYA